MLGLLKEQPMHGYELKKRLADVLPPLTAISFGSLYPALNRLERTGAVAAAAVALAPAELPMTGSFDGEAAAFRASRRIATRGPRNRKVYGITAAGDARLVELIADPGDDERSFPVKVAYCRFADGPTRIALFERRRTTLVDRLGQCRSALATPPLDRYGLSLLEHGLETTERDVAWLDRLLSAERALVDAERSAATVPPPIRLSAVDSPEPAAKAQGGT